MSERTRHAHYNINYHLVWCPKYRRPVLAGEVGKYLTELIPRRDWWHKVVFWLVNSYGLVALEELNLAFMLRNGKLSRVAHDVSLGLFYQFLDYKAIEAGVRVVKVNPHNTSQTCSQCGTIVEKDLSVRVHHCPHCGFTADRDVNAALNILSLAVNSDGTHPSGANVDRGVMRSLRSARL